jgi:molybdopterin molybdotransferase
MTDFESRVADWLDVEVAAERILKDARPTEVEEVSPSEALGFGLADDVTARWPLPPWDNSAMDGYAVRGKDIQHATRDIPTELVVVGCVLAGESFSDALQPGEAVRIMTGGPVPAGTDTVVRVEHTDKEERPGLVRIFDASDHLRNVRPAGQDWRAGDLVLAKGATIGPGTVGVLAAAGALKVPVHRRPVVAILPTGDELFDLEESSGLDRGVDNLPGIPESNSRLLAAQTVEAGGVPRRLGIARDNDEALVAAIDGASGSDALVTIGGASMGEGDRVKRVLDSLGFRQDFWRVNLRPGSPFSFGWLPTQNGELPVFGLPGNPASAFVTFEIFVRPFLRRLGGHPQVQRRVLRVSAGQDLHTARHLNHYLRVALRGSPGSERAFLTGHQGSGLVSSMASADGLAIVPAGTQTLSEGEPVDVLLLNQT